MFFVGLFSGAGGLDCGLERAGWQPVILSDYWQPAADTLKHNTSAKVFSWDVAKLTEPADVLDEIKAVGVAPEQIELVVGGPPCQAFSRLNQNQLFDNGEITDVNVNDPRRSLFMDFLRVVSFIKPKAVLMENVSDIAVRKLGGEGPDKDKLIVDVIHEEFRTNGYEVVSGVMNAVDYNVPQARKRMIFVAIRKDLNITPSLPAPVKLTITVLDQLNNIDQAHPNHIMKNHSAVWKEKVSHIPPGGYYKDLPIEYKVLKQVDVDYVISYTGQWRNFCFKSDEGLYEQFDTVWDKTEPQKKLAVSYCGSTHDVLSFIENKISGRDIFRIMPRMGTYLRRVAPKVSNTVTRNPLIHPYENRELTVCEKAAIQTFPNAYEFLGNTQDQNILIGNAVPCNMAKILGSHLIKLLDK